MEVSVKDRGVVQVPLEAFRIYRCLELALRLSSGAQRGNVNTHTVGLVDELRSRGGEVAPFWWEGDARFWPLLHQKL